MRTLTAAEENVLLGTNRATHVRVKIDPGTGFVDMTNLEGRDWLVSVSYGGGNDTPIQTAMVMLRRQANQLNLSPFVDASKLNVGGAIVDIANAIIIEQATIGQDQSPVESDYVEVFRGEIDEVDWGSDPIKVKCRDKGHLIVDTFIEVQRVYGNENGQSIETVIQNLIRDNINVPGLGGFSLDNPLELYSVTGTGSPAFDPADSPGFLIRTYIQSKEGLFGAIRRLAQMIGADVKYKFHTPTNQFQLVWDLPVRPIAARGKLTLTESPEPAETFLVDDTTFIARSKIRYVAAGVSDGADTYLLTSDNGVDWAEQTVPGTETSLRTDYSTRLGLWFMPTTAGKIFTSPDGIVWTERITPKTFQLKAIADNGTNVVCVGVADGSDAYIVTSTNGIEWTEQSNPKNAGLRHVLWVESLSLFVAVGDEDGSDCYIVTSPDGIAWTERANPKNFRCFTVAFGKGLLVAVGFADGVDAYIITSTDGITWTEQANPKNFTQVGVAYDGIFDLWVAVGLADGTDAYILTSPDGITWTEQTNPKNITLQDVTHDGVSLFVAVGNPDGVDAYIVSSPDGINWTERVNPKNITLASIHHHGPLLENEYEIGLPTGRNPISRFIAAGNVTGSQAYMVSSKAQETPAVTWIDRENPKNLAIFGMAHRDDDVLPRFVSVGDTDGDGYIITSDDGLSWIERANPKAFVLIHVAFGNGLWVAVGAADGTDAYILTSSDGITWTERTNPKNFQLRGVAYDADQGVWVAVGGADGADAYIVTSPDGITWTERANPKNFTLNAIAFRSTGAGIAVGVADGTDAYLILTNDGGATWLERSNPKNIDLNAVVFGGSDWVAVGNADGVDAYMVTSASDNNWFEKANPKNFDLEGVAFLDGLYCAVGAADGTDAYIITATVITAWTERSNPQNFGLNAIVARVRPIIAPRKDTLESMALAVTNSFETATGDRDSATSMIVEWGVPGVGGNAIVFTEAMEAATVDAATLGATRAGVAGVTIPDFTFNQDLYFNIARLIIKKQNIRTAVRIVFFDPDDLNTRFTVVRVDAAAEAKYGRRFMEITEASTSQINSVEEAGDLAAFAINDLSEPDAEQVIDLPYFWPVEDFDLYRFTANGQHYDTDQTLAIVSFRHNLTRDSARTSLTVRGKPAGGVSRWFNLEGDNIRNPASDLRKDFAPSSIVTESSVGVVIVEYDDPRTVEPGMPDWAYTECHINAGTSDFEPSVSTLKQKARTTRFEIGGLIPGDTFAAKLVAVDERGNKAASSVQFIQATERVGPFHENLDGQQDQLLRNNDFNIFTKGVSVPPDNWLMATDATWLGTVNVVTASADTLTGGNAIRMDVSSGVSPAIASNFFPVTEDDLLLIGAFLKADVSEASTDIRLQVTWSDIDKATLSSDVTAVTANQTTYQERNAAIFRAPSGTRYARVIVQGVRVSTNYSVDIDRVGCMRASPQAHRFTDGGSSNPYPATPETYIVPDFTAIAVEEVGLSYSAGIYTIEIPGPYIWSLGLFSEGGVSVHQLEGRIEHDSGSGFSLLTNQRVNSILFPPVSNEFGVIRHSTQIVEMAVGDRVQCRTRISVLGGQVSQGTNVFLSGKMMERNTK